MGARIREKTVFCPVAARYVEPRIGEYCAWSPVAARTSELRIREKIPKLVPNPLPAAAPRPR